jgi:hypothetical protein
LKIGRPDGWWNRRVPIARIALVVGVLLAGLYVWGAYGDLISSIIWGVRHQRTVSFRGQALRVPWFWQEKEWTNYNEFDLTRSYGGFTSPPTSVRVRYENSAPSDIQKRVERMLSQNAQTVKLAGYFYNNYEGNDFTKAHYVCLEQGLTWSPTLGVNCFSRDGRWIVIMFGSKQTLSEFETILRGVASMENPAK